MATSLKLVFGTNGEKKVSLTYPYVKASATPAQVKTLMQRIVVGGDIYADVPVAAVSAEFVDRTVTPVDLS